MWDKNKIKEYLRNNLLENRYNHTLGVVDTAIDLANIHGEDCNKAEIAALAHDVAKNMKIEALKKAIDEENIILTTDENNTQEIWHAIVGPILGRRIFEIEDEEILNAMRWHTTGKENMTKLEKIIYLADMIEPSRQFKGVDEIRLEAKVDLDKALMKALTHTSKYLLDKGFAIDVNTMKARNYLIYNQKYI